MRSKYFDISELVPKHMYNMRGNKNWRFIDERLISTIDTLKEHFSSGTMTINNYKWGGDREWSGLRTSQSPDYSPTSMHSFGKAIDCIFSHYSAEEVRLYILSNKGFFPYIRGMEDTVSWLHVDVRNEDELKLFQP